MALQTLTPQDSVLKLISARPEITGGWSMWIDTEDTSIVQHLTESEMLQRGHNADIYIEVKTTDIFGNESTSSSNSIQCLPINILTGDGLVVKHGGNIKLELGGDIVMEGSGGDSSEHRWLLNGGSYITFGAHYTDETLSIFPDTISTCNFYVGYDRSGGWMMFYDVVLFGHNQFYAGVKEFDGAIADTAYIVCELATPSVLLRSYENGTSDAVLEIKAGVTPGFYHSGGTINAAHAYNTPLIDIGVTHAAYTSFVQRINVQRAANAAYSFLVNYSGNYGDSESYMNGVGDIRGDGTVATDGGDYADYFEWADGNPGGENRSGLTVKLGAGGKIQRSKAGDELVVIGAISGKPSIVGRSGPCRWVGKYERDDFGAYVLDENGDRILSPDYDPDNDYVTRIDRPEWSPVGLVGRVRIKNGQPVSPDWKKIMDINERVSEWLIR